MWVISVGKEIICFDCPTPVSFIDSFKITRWGGVHQPNPRLLRTAELIIIDIRDYVTYMYIHVVYTVYICCNERGMVVVGVVD